MSIRPGERQGFWNSPAGLTLVVLLAAAGLYLWFGHRVHILGVLPLLLPLLVCLGMHLFMHRGRHGDHDGHGGEGDER